MTAGPRASSRYNYDSNGDYVSVCVCRSSSFGNDTRWHVMLADEEPVLPNFILALLLRTCAFGLHVASFLAFTQETSSCRRSSRPYPSAIDTGVCPATLVDSGSAPPVTMLDGPRHRGSSAVIASLKVDALGQNERLYGMRVVVENGPRQRRPPIHIPIVDPGASGAHEHPQRIQMPAPAGPGVCVSPLLVDARFVDSGVSEQDADGRGAAVPRGPGEG